MKKQGMHVSQNLKEQEHKMDTTRPNEWVNLSGDTSTTGIEPVFHERGYIRKLRNFDEEKGNGRCKKSIHKYKKPIKEKKDD